MSAVQFATEPAQVKIVEPQTLLARVQKLSEEISNRAYQIFEKKGRTSGHDLEDWFEAESQILPPFDLRITENPDSLTVHAEVPGFSARELSVSLEPWQLVISGEKESAKEQKKGEGVFQGKWSEQLMRVIDLPAAVDRTKATATLRNGVLEVHLPKSAKTPLARVEVKAA
jgi:HSP20 family protein